MLQTLPKKRIVSRIIRSNTGELAVGYFLVAEIEGQIYARLVRVEKLKTASVLASSKGHSTTLALPCGSRGKSEVEVRLDCGDYRSPYFSNSDTFFTSQMTRAPAEDRR